MSRVKSTTTNIPPATMKKIRQLAEHWGLPKIKHIKDVLVKSIDIAHVKTLGPPNLTAEEYLELIYPPE